MSIKFNHTAHKKLWNWLAENPRRSKWGWPEWESNGGMYSLTYNACFACDYAIKHPDRSIDFCNVCPFGNFAEGVTVQTCLNGLFEEWCDAFGLQEGAELALRIAKLPIRADMRVCVK